MSPKSFRCVASDPPATLGGMIPYAKDPCTLTGTLSAWFFVNVAVTGFEQGLPQVICTDSCNGAPEASKPPSTVIHSPLNRLGIAVSGLMVTGSVTEPVSVPLGTATAVSSVIDCGPVPAALSGPA